MKNETFFQSVVCAARGLAYSLRNEKNFRYYLAITLVFLAFNLAVKAEVYCYIFQILTSFGVFACECVNTAIEHLCNKITTEIDPEIKLIKDIAAGAVLCCGIAFFALEFVFIGRALLC